MAERLTAGVGKALALIELICLGEVGKDWEGTNTAVFEAER
jgi:hypothetical protein